MLESQEEKIEKKVKSFRRAMALRGELNLRVAKRVTTMLRGGMFSFAVIGLLLMVLLHQVTAQIVFMIEAMNTMNSHFTAMTENMKTMRTTMSAMEENVHEMPVIVKEIQSMTQSIQQMSTDILSVSAHMESLEKSMEKMTGNVVNMTRSFGVMDNTVTGIGSGVGRIAGPMHRFNRVTPAP